LDIVAAKAANIYNDQIINHDYSSVLETYSSFFISPQHCGNDRQLSTILRSFNDVCVCSGYKCSVMSRFQLQNLRIVKRAFQPNKLTAIALPKAEMCMRNNSLSF
jgi:hypothetical protein